MPLDFTEAPISGRLIAATDPVIGVPLEYYGFFAVHYTATDVSMAGAVPHFLTLNVCYPPGTTEKWLENTMRQLGSAARSLEIRILGGHTGGYDGLIHPFISSTCLGFLPEKTEPPRSVKPGDVLIAAGPVGRETLWFLANVEPTTIDVILDTEQRLLLAQDLSPFDVTSVATPLSKQEILLMHDLAEGGLTTAVTELSKATNQGLIIHYDAIPWDEALLTLCENLGWSPLHCSSFGSFLIVTRKDGASDVLREIKQHHRPAAIVGEFTKGQQILLDHDGKLSPVSKGHDPYKDYTNRLA